MEKIRIKLYKILRMLGLDRIQINLFSVFNQELKFDNFDTLCFLNFLEYNFKILIPDTDIQSLKTIDNTIDYLYKKQLQILDYQSYK